MSERPEAVVDGQQIRLENGESVVMRPNTEILCETHGITVLWGDLDGIQQFAVVECLDVSADLPCILSVENRRA